MRLKPSQQQNATKSESFRFFSFVICGPGQRIADHPNGIVISKINNRGSPRHAKSVDLIDCFLLLNLGTFLLTILRFCLGRLRNVSIPPWQWFVVDIISISPHIRHHQLHASSSSFVRLFLNAAMQRRERNFSSFIFLMCHFYSLLHVALTYTSSNNLSGGENVAQYVRFWKNNLFQLFFRGQCD